MFRWLALISAVVLVLSVTGAFVVSSQTQKPDHPQTSESNQEEPGKKEKHVPLFDRWFPDSTAVFNLFLMIFTGVLAVFTVWLALSTKDLRDFAEEQARDMKQSIAAARSQAKAAEDANLSGMRALQQSQRPWVIVESIELIKPISYSEGRYEILFHLNLKNTGNSVATDVFTVMRIEQNLVATLDVNWNKTDDDMRTKKEFIVKPSKWPLGIVLAPGQTVPQPFGFGGPTSTPGYPSEGSIRSGTFYLLGLVEYKDQFGIDHRTRFAFNPTGDSVNPWDGKTFIVSGGMQEAN